MTQLQRTIEESIATLRGLEQLQEPLTRAAQMVLACLVSGRKLLLCGNGGSASDATHLATEFLCRFRDDRRPYPAISLPANGVHYVRNLPYDGCRKMRDPGMAPIGR